MTTTVPPITKQIVFFPTESGAGKVHAAWKITHTAVCRPLVLDGARWYTTAVGETRVHPLVCRNCLRAAQQIEGVVQ